MSASTQQTTTGWVIFIAALGMLCGMLAIDIANLKSWADVSTPFFIGTLIGHLSAVIGAFIGGKLIPATREAGTYTRRTDPIPPTPPLPPAA